MLGHHKKLAENEMKRFIKENEELSHCTFKPDLSPSSSTAKAIKIKPKIALKANRAQRVKTEHTFFS